MSDVNEPVAAEPSAAQAFDGTDRRDGDHLAPEAPATVTTPARSHALDLDGIEADLADVESALARLDGGQYWTDEVTGAPLPDDLLEASPTARRNPTA